WLRAASGNEDQVVSGFPDSTEIPPRLEPSSRSLQRLCRARVPPFFFSMSGGSNSESYSREPATARMILTPKNYPTRDTSSRRPRPIDVRLPRQVVVLLHEF